jgi:hypothetical protein
VDAATLEFKLGQLLADPARCAPWVRRRRTGRRTRPGRDCANLAPMNIKAIAAADRRRVSVAWGEEPPARATSVGRARRARGCRTFIQITPTLYRSEHRRRSVPEPREVGIRTVINLRLQQRRRRGARHRVRTERVRILTWNVDDAQ